MKDKVKVIFRKDKKTGEIIAFFPETPVNRYNIMSYMHIGQHSEASYEFYSAGTKKAEPNEYEFLLKELKGIYEDDETELIIKTRLCYDDLIEAWNWKKNWR